MERTPLHLGASMEGDAPLPNSTHTPESLSDLSDLTGKPLEIRSTRDGDSVTIALAGEFDMAVLEVFDKAVRDCEETDIGAIVIDLSEVSFIDSCGLSALLEVRKRMNGRLHFVRPTHEAVSRVLAITDTDKVFN
jgi:anti-sigma B factor antagonist